MNAFLTTFPDKIIVSFPCGRMFSSKSIDEIISKMDDAGISGSDYAWIEHKWDKKIFSEPVEHLTAASDPLFTDRGNRVTFDREQVSDEDICLALEHARAMYGSPLTFIGDDPVFTARMAELAARMGIPVAK